jgi:hypothetical protein
MTETTTKEFEIEQDMDEARQAFLATKEYDEALDKVLRREGLKEINEGMCGSYRCGYDYGESVWFSDGAIEYEYELVKDNDYEGHAEVIASNIRAYIEWKEESLFEWKEENTKDNSETSRPGADCDKNSCPLRHCCIDAVMFDWKMERIGPETYEEKRHREYVEEKEREEAVEEISDRYREADAK